MAMCSSNESRQTPGAKESIFQEARNTVQNGLFRPYARKFLLLNAKDEFCKYPLGPAQLRIMFLQNIRNRQLRQFLLSVPGSIRHLSNAGQDAIANGLIPDFQDGGKVHKNSRSTRKRGYSSNAGVQKNSSHGQSSFGRNVDTFRDNSPVQGGRAFYIKKLTQEQLDLLGLEPVDDVSDDVLRNWDRRQR